MKEAVFAARLGGCRATVAILAHIPFVIDLSAAQRHQSGSRPPRATTIPGKRRNFRDSKSLQTAGVFWPASRAGRIFRSFARDGRRRTPDAALARRLRTRGPGSARRRRSAISPAAPADEITLRDNLAAWQPVRDARGCWSASANATRASSCSAAARPHPVLIAPTAFHRLAHPDGDRHRPGGCGPATSCACRPRDVQPGSRRGRPGGPRWFQLYLLHDRGVSRALVAQRAEHGYEALVVTVDLPVSGVRERELRTARWTPRRSGRSPAAAAAGSGRMTPPTTRRSGRPRPELERHRAARRRQPAARDASRVS